MRAIQLEKPMAFRTLDIPQPSRPGLGEALVRIHRIGICSTDYGGYLGKMPFYSYPWIPGHELGVEVLAIGCHAVDRGSPQPGESVLIIGSGPIGLSSLEFVRVAGARSIVLDINEGRLDFCKNTMGVDQTILAKGDGSKFLRLAEITGGQGAHVVIDATGSHHSMSNALEFCAFGGRRVYVGITQQDLQFPHAPMMHRRELSIMASGNALSRDFARIIRLIEQGNINTAPWITHHAKFEEMIEAFST